MQLDAATLDRDMNASANMTRTATRFQFLSRLLAGETGSGRKLDELLAEAADVYDLAEIGVRWPIPGVATVYGVAGLASSDGTLKWDAETVARLSDARSSNDAFVDSQEPHRLLVPIVSGKQNGVIWALARQPLDEEEIAALVVLAQCVCRHSAFIDKTGIVGDPARITQRLQDAATVAGKIAHDFDNIFTGVVGFAEMTQNLLESDSLPHQYVSEIIAAGNRGIVFTQQLHQMSRSGAVRPMPTSVAGVIAREEARLKKLPNPAVKLQFAAPANLPAVAMDGAALQQVIGSLLDNAVEASTSGGAVRLSAALVELSELESRQFVGSVSAGPFVELRIADEGPGVREDYRSRLFVEPFFTTKVRHRGLGLPVALRILAAHRGGARYEAASRGSVFHVVLPLAAARAPETGAS
jgi:signal transduction histidine kinase